MNLRTIMGAALFPRMAATAVTAGSFSYLVAPAGPGVHNLDFSVFKSFEITESKRLELRAEVFNLTNTPDFSAPSSTNFLDTQHFGKITSTQTNARLIQFAVKFYF